MNKILFKLIEGKGKFFLGMNWPEFPSLDDRTGKWYKETGGYLDPSEWYEREVNACISEALMNGEIVNPEVLPGIHQYMDGTYFFVRDSKPLNDNDIFDLPDGWGFEEVIIGPSLPIHAPHGSHVIQKEAIRLLPEKPVQKVQLSKEDQERIENAALEHPDTKYSLACHGFILGAKYEHPIARKEGFNEALEEVKTMLGKFDIASGAHHDSEIIEEIEKLKR